MKKTKELAVQKRQMVVDIHKCGNGLKKISKGLNIPLSTFRAIAILGYWGEWWENQQNPQGSQWKNRRPWWRLGGHQVSKSLIGRVTRSKPFLTTRHRRTHWNKVLWWVFVRYNIGIFGVGTEMHTSRSTSYPRWNIAVGQSCFGAVLIPEVEGHWLGLMA